MYAGTKKKLPLLPLRPGKMCNRYGMKKQRDFLIVGWILITVPAGRK
jgi:hypothetical protein